VGKAGAAWRRRMMATPGGGEPILSECPKWRVAGKKKESAKTAFLPRSCWFIRL
jgi:hypothetical protein